MGAEHSTHSFSSSAFERGEAACLAEEGQAQAGVSSLRRVAASKRYNGRHNPCSSVTACGRVSKNAQSAGGKVPAGEEAPAASAGRGLVSLLPLKEKKPTGIPPPRQRVGDGELDILRTSGRRSEKVSRIFATALRKAVQENKPGAVAALLHETPQATQSGLLFGGDSDCLVVMNDVVRRRDPALLAAFLRCQACTPEQIWPCGVPGCHGPSVAALFAPEIVGDSSKCFSHTADKLLLPSPASAPASRQPACVRQSESSLTLSDGAVAPPAGPPSQLASQYTYLYLPAPPARGAAVSVHPEAAGSTAKTAPKDDLRAASAWRLLGGKTLSWYGKKRTPPARESQEGKRVLRALTRQSALRLGDAILLEGDARCIDVMLDCIRRPSLFLVAAAATASVDTVQRLLRRGANPNTVVHGFSPLNVAASSTVSPYEKVELLLRYGAAPDFPLVPVAAPSRTRAATDPPHEVPTVAGSEDLPALMHAVVTGDLSLAELLLEQGADPNIFVEALGLPTPLFQAVFWGDLKMVKLLCAYGADPSIAKPSGESVLQTASRALQFSLLRKPRHIAKLPLPRSSPALCRQIRRILEDSYAERSAAARTAVASGRAAATAAAPEARTARRTQLGFRMAWESRVFAEETCRGSGQRDSKEKKGAGERETGKHETAADAEDAETVTGTPTSSCRSLEKSLKEDEKSRVGKASPPATGRSQGAARKPSEGCQVSRRVDKDGKSALGKAAAPSKVPIGGRGLSLAFSLKDDGSYTVEKVDEMWERAGYKS
ncbi:ankyrin repeat-containing protein [Besnoitia besnoiti]|uniref:Ankyrin repeat-containing protein n=1 Tax=Besnoitia besnoiti TaxID=94643 RepID=A0A2A9MA95_BESBE|nr:ankyrin repeat-containing protein [Besnoitia besnoiti]PFH32856.1 ankyrin repeat-containing protein [Besnoitia besnoiti]